MLPALCEEDISAFSEALYGFNRSVGEMFHKAQGGIYAHRQAEEMVTYLRTQKIHGVGQSSWGPVLFAMMHDREQAEYFTTKIQKKFCLSPQDVYITQAKNSGADFSCVSTGSD